VDLVEGRLPPDEQAKVESHLTTCTHCAGERARLERTINLMRTDESEAPPPVVLNRVLQRFRPQPESATSSLRERLVAALQFDSAHSSLAFGIRSAQPAPRQLLYQAGSYNLDLRIAPAGGLWAVSGQVLGPNTEGQVELSGASAAHGTLNEQSEFTLPPVPAGVYTFVMLLPDVEVEVAELAVGT
jgi:anti-sigma factor RsiW